MLNNADNWISFQITIEEWFLFLLIWELWLWCEWLSQLNESEREKKKSFCSFYQFMQMKFANIGVFCLKTQNSMVLVDEAEWSNYDAKYNAANCTVNHEDVFELEGSYNFRSMVLIIIVDKKWSIYGNALPINCPRQSLKNNLLPQSKRVVRHESDQILI